MRTIQMATIAWLLLLVPMIGHEPTVVIRVTWTLWCRDRRS